MGMAEAGQFGEVLADALAVGEGAGGDVFEHGVAAGCAVPDLPDGAGGSGPELPAQAVAGEICEVHAQEDAPIAHTPAEVIHSPGSGPRPGSTTRRTGQHLHAGRNRPAPTHGGAAGRHLRTGVRAGGTYARGAGVWAGGTYAPGASGGGFGLSGAMGGGERVGPRLGGVRVIR
ncbi:hypothetical protein JOF29_007936 [Kribbella aluminosa]|uniref:Uncharacterized protein n=1 Tax=Kribbella aluminosa TaxID=416017 RepID=A0ABS4UYX3_9ACTN|nr:hypothetical protein [Kribbella aluminosa]